MRRYPQRSTPADAGRGAYAALWSLIAPPSRADEAGETQSKKGKARRRWDRRARQ